MGPRNRALAAASSSASGSPSNLQQIDATAAAFVGVSEKPGGRLAGPLYEEPGGRCPRHLVGFRLLIGVGHGQGGDGYSRSSLTLNGARLVASMRRSGNHWRSSATTGAASNTCSKLSRTRRYFLGPNNGRGPPAEVLPPRPSSRGPARRSASRDPRRPRVPGQRRPRRRGIFLGPPRRFDSQAGLAYAPGSREREQPRFPAGKQSRHFLDLPVPSHQRGQGGRRSVG